MARKRAHGEGTLRRRSDGRWEARVTLPDGTLRSVYGKTQGEAIAKRSELVSRVTSGLSVGAERMTLAAYLDQWITEVAVQAVRPGTVISYRSHITVWITPTIGAVTLAKLSPAHVQRLQSVMLSAGLAASTVQRVRATLRRALNTAVRWRIIPVNPVPMVDAPKAEPYRHTVLDVDGARRLLDATEGTRMGCLIAVALATGLRQGELLGLTWACVDLDSASPSLRVEWTLKRTPDGMALLPPKTERGRRLVPLVSTAVSALRHWRANYAMTSPLGLVFTTPVGTPINNSNLIHRFQEILAEVGLPRMRWHDLRHTCASLLLTQGVPMRVIMEILGHGSITTTSNIYAHVSSQLTAASLSLLETALWSDGGQSGRQAIG